MCLNFNLGGLTSSCPHLTNAADVGVDLQQLDKLCLANRVHSFAVISRCGVRLSSAQSCWRDCWTKMSHNKHGTEDSFMSYWRFLSLILLKMEIYRRVEPMRTSFIFGFDLLVFLAARDQMLWNAVWSSDGFILNDLQTPSGTTFFQFITTWAFLVHI